MAEFVKTNIQSDGLVFVTIDRPPMNALSIKLISELHTVVNVLKKNKDIRCVILHSSHKNFCAGADLKERKILSLDDAGETLDSINNCFNAFESIPVPTIAAINGYCLGGGTELSLCCDFRVLEENAIIGLPEVSIGIIPGAGGTQRLPKIIGLSTAKYWIYSARKFTAEEALEDGVADFLSTEGELLETAIELAEEIMANAPISIRSAKQAIGDGTSVTFTKGMQTERKAYNLTLNSKDRKEALKAFTDKRKPKWQGK